MEFFKYQGTGNDFILIDQRTTKWLRRGDEAKIARLCDRRFGIGADGLILLENHPDFDFEMIYFNADGRESSMCGNGGRCIVAFARHLKIIEYRCRFLAIDGPHIADAGLWIAKLQNPKPEIQNLKSNWVALKMSDVQTVENQGVDYILNTGSPHFVRFENSLDGLDIFAEGRKIRNSERFKTKGINVNFIEKNGAGSRIKVATYERGVEDETFSCGTGVTAAAIAFYLENPSDERQRVLISTKGGELEVRFVPDGRGGFEDIWLCGPAEQVFVGEWP